MKRTMWIFGLLLGVVAGACGGSCSSSAVPPDGGGGSAVDASGGADALSDHDAAAADEDKDAPEEPWGEPGWKAVPWGAPCGEVDVAEKPELAVPPLIWDPCPDGGPGCELARVAWDHGDNRPFTPPRVIRWGAGHRVGVLLFYPEQEVRTTIYDEGGKPLVAWRASGCVLFTPTVTSGHVWTGAQHGAQTSWIVETYEALGTATSPIKVDAPAQGVEANDTSLGLWGLSGIPFTIYDRLSNTAKTFSPPPGIGYNQPYPVNDSALVRLYPEFNRAEGWIWNRSTSTTTPLVQPGSSQSVADIRSDGTTMVWVQGQLPLDAKGFYPSADLWTSPFTTDKNGIAAMKRRSVPTVGDISASVGDGFYALYGPVDKVVHIYRLSDAQHWSFTPPASSMHFFEISYVDADAVWYQTLAGIYRQSLSALGPGDPPP